MWICGRHAPCWSLPTLVASGSVTPPVDFRLADWLLKGDAREHFERGARETKTPDADKRGYVETSGSEARGGISAGSIACR